MGMNIGDFLFGTKSEADFRTLPTKSKEQQKAIDDLTKLLSGEVQNFDTQPALTDKQQGLQQLLDSFTGTLGQGGNALNQALQFDQGQVDQLFQQSVADPLMRQFEQDVLPMISRRFAPNFFGSDRALADVRAVGDLMTTLSAERAKFTNEERNRQLQALGLLPGVTGAATEMSQAGDMARNERENAFQKRLQLINALLGTTGQNQFENIGVAKPGQAGALSGFLSGIGQGLGASMIPG